MQVCVHLSSGRLMGERSPFIPPLLEELGWPECQLVGGVSRQTFYRYVRAADGNAKKEVIKAQEAEGFGGRQEAEFRVPYDLTARFRLQRRHVIV